MVYVLLIGLLRSDFMVNVENTNYWEESYEVGFSAWIEKHGYSKKTAQTYKSMFFAFIAFLEEKNVSLDKCNKTIMELYFKSRVIDDKTKARYLWLIADVFEDMVESEHLKVNVMSLVLDKKRKGMRGKTSKREPTVLTKSDTKLLEDYIAALPRHYSGMRERCALLLLLGCGLRAQELCDLRTNNVHLKEEAPYLRIIGKFDKERLIPIPESIIDELLYYVDSKSKLSPFFLSSKKAGNPYVPSSIYRLVRSAMEDAGITKEKLSPHVLRHTYCTRQLEDVGKEGSNITLQIVKNWMGHDSIATTAKYEHVVTSIYSAKPVI